MTYRAVFGLCGLLLAILVVPAMGQNNEVPRATALRHVGTENGLRLMLDVAPVPPFTVFTLANPDRLVIDFPQVNWALPADLASDTEAIASVRHGLFREGRSRLILELSQPMQVEKAFSMPVRGGEPGRVVIDLVPTDRASFDAAAGAPEAARWRGTAPSAPIIDEGEMIIAIDAGHGGIDPGASGGGLSEKTVVLEFARRLAVAIDAHDGMRAYLVREHDEFVPLGERIARAHGARANVLISIHADSVASGTADGVSVYTLSQKGTDQAAEAFAERENRADILGGADLFGESDTLTRLLVELAQRGTDDESQKLGAAMIRALQGRVAMLQTRPLRRGNFRVLKAPDIPSVLLEIGFLDSPRDRERLTDPEWRDRAAKGIVEGLLAWRKTASPGFVAPK